MRRFFRFSLGSKIGWRGRRRRDSGEKREIHLQDLANGFPQIRFEELGLQPVPLFTLYQDLVKLLIPYTGSAYDFKTEPSPEKIGEYAREIFLGKGPLIVSGASEDLAKTASGLVLAPYLLLACEWDRAPDPSGFVASGILPRLRGQTLLRRPDRQSTGPRTLMCPRCFGEWSYNRIGCPFCNAKGVANLLSRR